MNFNPTHERRTYSKGKQKIEQTCYVELCVEIGCERISRNIFYKSCWYRFLSRFFWLSFVHFEKCRNNERERVKDKFGRFSRFTTHVSILIIIICSLESWVVLAQFLSRLVSSRLVGRETFHSHKRILNVAGYISKSNCYYYH